MCKQVYICGLVITVWYHHHTTFLFCVDVMACLCYGTCCSYRTLGFSWSNLVGAFLIHTFMACVQNMHPAPFSLGLLLSVHPLSHVYIHRNVAEQVHVTVLVGWHLHIPYPVYMCMYGLTGCDV